MTEWQPFFDAEGGRIPEPLRALRCICPYVPRRGLWGSAQSPRTQCEVVQDAQLPKTAKRSERDAAGRSVSELGDLAAGG